MSKSAAQKQHATGSQPKLLADRYEMLSFIGAGVTSKVYKAIDRKFNKTVAVKMLNPYLATDPVSIERFKREAQITRILQHPQIATVTDIFKFQGQLFLVMDFAEGVSLKDFIHVEAPLNIDRTIGIIGQLLGIMNVCHAKNIIHRDIKPQNIVIDDQGNIKLLDFGIARMTSLSDLTQTGTSLGTPEYMAPELFATNTYDPRTDLYAIGVIAYELLTGSLPFQGDTLAVLYTRHLQEKATPPVGLRADTPGWLSDFVLHLLAKLPYQRYQTAEEALKDLKRKRVLLKDVPDLNRILCFSCGESTYNEVSTCICCGADRDRLFLSGGTSLRATDTTDRRKLREFLSKTFRLPPKKCDAGRNQLIVRDVPEKTSSTIKALAIKDGIYLQNSGPALDPRIKFYIVCVPVLALTIQNFKNTFFSYGTDFSPIGLISCIGILFFCWSGIKRNTAIIKDNHLALADSKIELPDNLSKIFGNKNLGTNLKDLLVQLLRKYILVTKSGFAGIMTLHEQLKDLLIIASEMTEAMGMLQSELDKFDPRVAMEMLEDSREQLAAASTEFEKRQKERQYSDLIQVLKDYQNKEETLSRLNNKLIQINAAFNQLTAQACVLHTPIDAATVDSLRSLNDDLRVQHSIDEQVPEAGGSD